jgi:hypothetical protein
MNKALAPFIALVLCSFFAPTASAEDVLRYLDCRADNEDGQSLVVIDETAKRVCDPEFSPHWMTPSAFDGSKIEWGDGGGSTKSITHGRKGSRYEHDTYFIVVHIGHCKKIKAPSAQPCPG